MTAAQLVREYFPDSDDDLVETILWGYTGFPSFFDGPAEDELRKQLQHLKDVGFDQVDAEIDAQMNAQAS